MVVGLPVRYETWPAIAWHHPLVIDWSKYRLVLPRVALHWAHVTEFSPFLKGHWQSPCTAVTAGICLPLGLCQGTVKESALVPEANQHDPIHACTWILKQNDWHFLNENVHYNDVIMSAMASQITSLTIVYSTVYSGADQRNFKAPRHWPSCGEFTGDQWIPRTNGQ